MKHASRQGNKDYQAKSPPSPTSCVQPQPQAPVHLPRDVFVIHEALNVQWQVRAVGAHELFQFLTLLMQTKEGSDFGFCI